MTTERKKTNGGKAAGRRGGAVPEVPRQVMIAAAAYFRAEQRGFVGGDSLDDWLAAEAEVDERLRQATDARKS